MKAMSRSTRLIAVAAFALMALAIPASAQAIGNTPDPIIDVEVNLEAEVDLAAEDSPIVDFHLDTCGTGVGVFGSNSADCGDNDDSTDDSVVNFEADTCTQVSLGGSSSEDCATSTGGNGGGGTTTTTTGGGTTPTTGGNGGGTNGPGNPVPGTREGPDDANRGRATDGRVILDDATLSDAATTGGTNGTDATLGTGDERIALFAASGALTAQKAPSISAWSQFDSMPMTAALSATAGLAMAGLLFASRRRNELCDGCETNLESSLID